MKGKKSIVILIIIFVLLILVGVVGAYVWMGKKTQKISNEWQNGVASDLSLKGAKEAFIICREAFKNSDKAVLRACLSKDTLNRMNTEGEDRYLSLWKSSFESCGGYDRPIIGVENYYQFDPKDDRTRVEYGKDVAYIYFENNVNGCSNSVPMRVEDGAWKFSDR